MFFKIIGNTLPDFKLIKHTVSNQITQRWAYNFANHTEKYSSTAQGDHIQKQRYHGMSASPRTQTQHQGTTYFITIPPASAPRTAPLARVPVLAR
jgi:hypothetical protein